jgi:hypothetical protein
MISGQGGELVQDPLLLSRVDDAYLTATEETNSRLVAKLNWLRFLFPFMPSLNG